jgi:hypothetical protein
MREYNKKYYLKHRPEPKPKKIKEPKPPKLPRVVKPKTPKKEKPNLDFVVPEYVYPTKIARGNFILSFD